MPEKLQHFLSWERFLPPAHFLELLLFFMSGGTASASSLSFAPIGTNLTSSEAGGNGQIRTHCAKSMKSAAQEKRDVRQRRQRRKGEQPKASHGTRDDGFRGGRAEALKRSYKKPRAIIVAISVNLIIRHRALWRLHPQLQLRYHYFILRTTESS